MHIHIIFVSGIGWSWDRRLRMIFNNLRFESTLLHLQPFVQFLDLTHVSLFHLTFTKETLMDLILWCLWIASLENLMRCWIDLRFKSTLLLILELFVHEVNQLHQFSLIIEVETFLWKLTIWVIYYLLH